MLCLVPTSSLSCCLLCVVYSALWIVVANMKLDAGATTYGTRFVLVALRCGRWWLDTALVAHLPRSHNQGSVLAPPATTWRYPCRSAFIGCYSCVLFHIGDLCASGVWACFGQNIQLGCYYNDLALFLVSDLLNLKTQTRGEFLALARYCHPGVTIAPLDVNFEARIIRAILVEYLNGMRYWMNEISWKDNNDNLAYFSEVATCDFK